MLKVREDGPVRSIDHEPDGSVEFVSKKMSDSRGLKSWLDNYGWGHVHTSFVRSGDPVAVKQQVNWNAMANQYMFLSALERRQAPGPTSPTEAGRASGVNWAFAIKPLSIPTQEHVELWEQFLTDKTERVTAFSKHLLLNVRTGMYEDDNGVPDPARVGNEIRGGLPKEKERVLDSLTHALVDGKWGRAPEEFGANGFRLMSVGGDMRTQVRGVPRDFETMLAAHLKAGVPGVNEADASKLYEFVADARFYDGPVVSRMTEFDQRVGAPLLSYEKLGWLTQAEKGRAINARTAFIQRLSALQTQAANTNMPATEVAQRISALVINWGKEASLAEPIGRWVDGDRRRSVLAQ